MLFCKTLKSGLTAAFFMVCTLWPLWGLAQTSPTDIDWLQTEKAMQLQALDRHHVWHALLHLNKGQPQIRAPGFILSQDGFTPHREMLATLSYLYGHDQHAVCRFPGRYLWLKTHLSLPELPITQCQDINEFIQKAPFDELTLVFATESVTQPASMMGHTFLKVSGQNASGQLREHAVSYYTDANSINLAKLLWESLVSGKKGIFSLTPYAREAQKYIDEEHRNLWEYKIRTTAFQRELIRNHLFELQQTELTYFLHSYNCATVLQNILGLTWAFQDFGPGWTTPKDVVRQARQSGLIEATGTFVSDQWTYAFLRPKEGSHFDPSAEDALRSTQDRPLNITSSQQTHFLKALNHVLLEKKTISPERWQKNHAQLTPPTATGSPAPLELPGELDPALSQGDRRAALSLLSRPQGWSTLLNFMPASHRLHDRHHHQIAETEVQLFSGTLEVTPKSTLKLHQFNILSMKSLPPWNKVLKPVSSQVGIGYGPLSGHPADPKTLHAHGAVGITLQLTPHLDMSFLWGGGFQTRSNTSSIFMSSEILALYRSSSSTKTLFSWRHWQSPNDHTRSIKVQQMLYLDSGVSIWADMDVTQKSGFQRHTLGLGIQQSF